MTPLEHAQYINRICDEAVAKVNAEHEERRLARLRSSPYVDCPDVKYKFWAKVMRVS